MRAFGGGISVVVLLFAAQASVRAQSLEVLHDAAESVAAGQCGCYKTPVTP